MAFHDNPDAAEFDLPIFDTRTPPIHVASVTHSPLGNDALLANPASLTDQNLLELLLGAIEPAARRRDLAIALLTRFQTVSRTLAAPADRIRSVAGIDNTHIALLKTAETLAIRHARAAVPAILHPTLDNYSRVIEYCRTLAGHRSIEEFHLLHLDRKNRLIRDECHQRGTVSHTPAYTREICIRALDNQTSAMIIVHNHPANSAEPSRTDISTTETLRDALKLIDVTLHDHLIVTASDAFSFRAKGLL